MSQQGVEGVGMTFSIKSFTGQFAWLSNFYTSVILIDELTYPTVEHAFQAAKTLNLIEREAIRDARSPGVAKRMGRHVQLRTNWETIKFDVMKNCLRAKFSVEPLRQLLLDTDNAHLEEGNTWGDTCWGTVNGHGANYLGRLLMEVRTELRSKDAGTIQPCDEYPLKSGDVEILFADAVRGWTVDNADSYDYKPMAFFYSKELAEAFADFLHSDHCPEDLRTSTDFAITPAFAPRILTANDMRDEQAVAAMVTLYGGSAKDWQ
jgi:ribA/ribD-fused uncharacterized protein